MIRTVAAIILTAAITPALAATPALADTPTPTPAASPGLIGGLLDGIVGILTGSDPSQPPASPDPQATTPAATQPTPDSPLGTPAPAPVPGQPGADIPAGNEHPRNGADADVLAADAPEAAAPDQHIGSPADDSRAQSATPDDPGMNLFIVAAVVTAALAAVVVAVTWLLIWRRRPTATEQPAMQPVERDRDGGENTQELIGAIVDAGQRLQDRLRNREAVPAQRGGTDLLETANLADIDRLFKAYLVGRGEREEDSRD